MISYLSGPAEEERFDNTNAAISSGSVNKNGNSRLHKGEWAVQVAPLLEREQCQEASRSAPQKLLIFGIP